MWVSETTSTSGIKELEADEEEDEETEDEETVEEGKEEFMEEAGVCWHPPKPNDRKARRARPGTIRLFFMISSPQAAKTLFV
jgi:hypothetical protein